MFFAPTDRHARRGTRSAAVFSALFILLTSVSLTLEAQGKVGPSRPNILFIFTDDHGAQTISAYGSNRNRTPGIDRIAEEGMRFDNCFVTNSICAPSRATILTGRHTHMTGHTTNERIFDNRLVTFPALLQKAGYQTALIGKWHLNVEPKGFDYWDILINQGVYYNPQMIRNGQFFQHEGYTTDVLTDLALEWLSTGRDTTRPFLLMAQHKAPHRGWDPALRHLTMFDDSTIPEPPTLFDDWSNRSSAWSYSEMSIARHLWPGDFHLETPTWLLNEKQRVVWDSIYSPKNEAFRAAKLAGKPLVQWKYQRYAKDYLRTVAAVDESVERLLRYLDDSGLARNTIVMYSSDQGWYLGEHGMFDKRWMYEESLRMPFLVRWPGVVSPKSVNRDLVQNLDFAPTILEIAGVEIPENIQGRSLVPLLRGTTPPDWRKSVYYHFYEDKGAHKVPRHYGIRTDRYKLIHYYKIHEWELFDLVKDPLELVSVYFRPEYKDIERSLAIQLDTLRARAGVTDEADREYDVFQRQLDQRWKFISLLGRLPSRWNIDVDTLALDEFDTYRRETIAYTIGDERVEAFVLVPKNKGGLMPGMIAVHPEGESGSYTLGKSQTAGLAGNPSLSYGLELCRRGYVVLCPDRIGYESRQRASGKASVDSLTRTARELLVRGSTLAGQELMELWFAASYLSKRPDVHALRVGVIGYGEGGLLATLVAYLDQELLTAVSLSGTGSAGGGGMETAASRSLLDLLTIPGRATWGALDEAIAGIYPRPFFGTYERMDQRWLFESAEQRYKDLDYSDRLEHRLSGSSGHGPMPQIHKAAYDWCDRWLKW